MQLGVPAKNVTVNVEDNSLIVMVDDAKTATPQIVREIVNSGGLILSVNVIRSSLEEAYLKLVGKTENESSKQLACFQERLA